MKGELLNYLESSIKQNWLHCYSNDLALAEENCVYLLYQRTIEKLAQIQNISAKIPAIFIAEENSLNFISAYLAGTIAGGQLFLCNPAWQQREWQQVLNLAKPDLVFGAEVVRSQIAELAPSKALAIAETSESLIMIPTGGTSGKIKFAIHTWSTLTASVSGFQQFFECEKINSWCTLPLYHVSGLMQLMRSLVTQGNLAISPYQLTNSAMDRGSYFISLVPTQLEFLLESHPDWLQGFQTVLIGGAPARKSLLDRARDRKIAIALIYGSTETASGVVAMKPKEFWAGNTSNGKTLPHARVSISHVAESNNNVESDRHIGSIVIDSTSLFLGYYPQLKTASQPLITDDLGYIDAQECLYLVGRNSHKIITGGENVFPSEVEAAIYATSLVDDVCVFGIPDRYWGQAVTAVYVPHNSQSDLSKAIAQQIQSQLAKYKQPKNWIAVEHIPRNNRGKIDYQQLKAIAISKMQNKQFD